jgi:hypothetical protein
MQPRPPIGHVDGDLLRQRLDDLRLSGSILASFLSQGAEGAEKLANHPAFFEGMDGRRALLAKGLHLHFDLLALRGDRSKLVVVNGRRDRLAKPHLDELRFFEVELRVFLGEGD